jgi:glyoxylase-like metal-dependent hydrolase (beta-lactamase superfamily II)
MLRGKPTGQVGTIAIGGLSPYDRVRIRRRRLEALARPLCRSNSDAAEIQKMGESVRPGRIIKIGEFMEPSKKERFHGSLRFRFVRGLAVCSAVTSVLFLISCPSALARGQHGFSIKVFTSTEDQFWTNSVIIEGTNEVMLVDAQLTKTNAERVLQQIKETKKALSIIYITHEHADHFLGLEVFKEAYPRVRIIANSAVVDRINKVYREKIDKWKTILGSGATSQVVAIEKFNSNFIEFESSKIEVLKGIQGDTDENTMLWIPGQRILVAGDVVFNNMHVYTAETDGKARGKWLSSLQKIRELKPSVVIPGHSKVGAPLDASTAVDFTETYLLVFEEEVKKAKGADGLINTMKERFPSADLLLAIERGARANVKP